MKRQQLTDPCGLLLTACCLWMQVTSAGAQPAPEVPNLTGYAYDLDSGKLLYSEHHDFVYEGERLISDTVSYRRPDGREFGVKLLDFRPNLYVPDFHTKFPGIGYEEGLRRRAGQLELFRSLAGKDDSKALEPTPNSAADAGFHPYVQKHFDQLMAGEKIRFEFISADFQAKVRFKAWRIDDDSFEGRPVVRFKVRVASLIGLFVDPLIVSYDPNTLHLVEFRGLSNVKDENGDSYKARIIFPAEAPSLQATAR